MHIDTSPASLPFVFLLLFFFPGCFFLPCYSLQRLFSYTPDSSSTPVHILENLNECDGGRNMFWKAGSGLAPEREKIEDTPRF